jgi:hypothetical protein
MKYRSGGFSLLACAVFSGCSGPVVRTLTVEPGVQIIASRPSLSYNLKRSRYDAKVELKIVRETTWRKNLADEWIPDRENAVYRLVAHPNATSVSHVFEDDPYLLFAIHTDTMESAATNTKKFEIKFDSANTLASINAEFEDTTLKVVENVVQIASDVVKFSAGVALTAVGSKSISPTVKIEEEVLEKPVLAFEASVIARDATTSAAGFHTVIADETAINQKSAGANAEILALHKALNGALFEQLKGKHLATEKDPEKLKAIKDAKSNLDLLNATASPTSIFYSEDPTKVVVNGFPKELKLSIKPDIPLDAATAVADLNKRSKLTAAEIGAAVTEKTGSPSTAVPGVFFRRPGRATVTLTAVIADNSSAVFLSQRMDSSEAGMVEFALVETRLFTNRTIGLKFGGNGMLTEYSLISNSASGALSQAIADGVNNGLVTAESVKKQQKEDAKQAETDQIAADTKTKEEAQEAANTAARVRAKESAILDKKLAIAAQERTASLRQEDVKTAGAEQARLAGAVPPMPSAEASDTLKAAYTAAKQAADGAKLALGNAEGQEFAARQQLTKLKFELDVLEKELEVVKSGLTIPTGS